MIGSLIYNDYKKLFIHNQLITSKNINNQIQPSSMDLSLSEECYEIKCSFLSPNSRKEITRYLIGNNDINPIINFETGNLTPGLYLEFNNILLPDSFSSIETK